MPAAIGRVLNVVRKLIDYGKELAATVQQRAATPGFALFARSFGTADLAVILARITNGLRRAAALEAGLCRRATRGQDLTPTPSACPPRLGPAPRARSRRRAAPRTPTRQPHRGPASRAPPHGRRKSPPRCVVGRSAPSSPISAAISASCPAGSTGRSGANSAGPSSSMAEASPAFLEICAGGCSRTAPVTTPTARTPDGRWHPHD